MIPLSQSGAAGGLDLRRCLQAARAAGLFAFVVGLTVLLGWLFDFRPFMSVLPALVSMKPNTAMTFCVAGLSLLLFITPPGKVPGRKRTLSLAFAAFVASFGAITLSQYLTGFDLGIDQLLFQDFARSRAPGRMAPLSALNFVFVGAALFCIHFRAAISWAHGLAASAALSSMLAIVGYIYGAKALYQSGDFTAVALHTAITFLVLSTGIWLATSRSGFMKVITGAGISGRMARRFGIAALVLPVTFGWLRLQGQLHGWYGLEVGLAIFAMANVVTFALLVRIGAASLRIAEEMQERVQESLHRAHLGLEQRVHQRTSELANANAGLQEEMTERARVEHAHQQIMDHSLDVICTFDAEGRFLQVSRACEEVWGYRPEELIGRMFSELVHPDDRAKTAAADRSIVSGQAMKEFENRYLRRDGCVVPMLWTANWSEEHQINFCVARDITARKRMESELLRAKEAAEKATKVKGDFLANMSHEIRTPMNGVIGMTSLLLDTKLNAEQRQFAETIHASGESLLAVINDILDFSKIESGKLLFEDVDFDLRSTVQETLEMLASAAQLKGLELIGVVQPEVNGRLRGDAGRVRQVLTNLLGNAIKFTSQGEVALRISSEEETESHLLLRCEVQDTGIGIAPDVQERLFEAFVQADGSTSRKFGGSGLGLVISRSLAEAMQGRMGIESVPGEGSTFWFTMRLAKQIAPAVEETHNLAAERRVLVVDDNATSRELIHKQVMGWRFRNGCARNAEEALLLLRRAAEESDPYAVALIDSDMPETDGLSLARMIKESAMLRSTSLILLTPFGRTPSAADLRQAGISACRQKPVRQSNLFECIIEVLDETVPSAPTLDSSPISPTPVERAYSSSMWPLRILVAEDNAVNQRVALGQLKHLGYAADVAVNGVEVIEAVKRNVYDVVFMDCQMPEMDGYEATAAIHAIRGAERPWIIAMTAHSMTGDREKCLAAGMDDYMSKPARRPEIQAALARAKKPQAADELLKDLPGSARDLLEAEAR